MIFVGPNDPALSILGYVPAKGDEPEFINAIEEIVNAARKHGKWVGQLLNDGIAAEKHLDTFDTVALSYDVHAIMNLYSAELEAACSP
jgi:4-hydroxy-2-oxoheptanedioate aldolase